MKKKLFPANQIINYLKKQGFTISQKKNRSEENNIENIARTFLASVIIITTFFVSPIIVEFTKNTSFTSNDYENNSKNSLKKLLEKKNTELIKDVDKIFLFEDILIFDEKLADSVRLSAITIEELFKSTKYNLKDVRKNKLVKPISLTLLPNEIKK